MKKNKAKLSVGFEPVPVRGNEVYLFHNGLTVQNQLMMIYCIYAEALQLSRCNHTVGSNHAAAYGGRKIPAAPSVTVKN